MVRVESQSINNKPHHHTTIVVYISLTLSVILTVIFLLFGIAALVVHCKSKESKSKSSHHTYDRPESVYEDILDDNYNTGTKGIEMKKNVVYKRP